MLQRFLFYLNYFELAYLMKRNDYVFVFNFSCHSRVDCELSENKFNSFSLKYLSLFFSFWGVPYGDFITQLAEQNGFIFLIHYIISVHLIKDLFQKANLIFNKTLKRKVFYI